MVELLVFPGRFADFIIRLFPRVRRRAHVGAHLLKVGLSPFWILEDSDTYGARPAGCWRSSRTAPAFSLNSSQALTVSCRCRTLVAFPAFLVPAGPKKQQQDRSDSDSKKANGYHYGGYLADAPAAPFLRGRAGPLFPSASLRPAGTIIPHGGSWFHMDD